MNSISQENVYPKKCYGTYFYINLYHPIRVQFFWWKSVAVGISWPSPSARFLQCASLGPFPNVPLSPDITRYYQNTIQIQTSPTIGLLHQYRDYHCISVSLHPSLYLSALTVYYTISSIGTITLSISIWYQQYITLSMSIVDTITLSISVSTVH